MKGRKLLAGFLSAAMVLGTMAFPVFAANETYTVDAENSLDSVISQINASASGNVVVNLETDATLQLPDYYANLVNDDVKSLTINGNSHTLDVDATYRLKFNMEGTLKLNDVTVKSNYSEANTWDAWDFLFNCNVEFTNVIFNREIALEKNAVLTGVTVNNSSASDSYAIWIPATPKTVKMENVTINAADPGKRGIKIDEQYCDEKVGVVDLTVKNSTFNTYKKSAILVKSKAGANIVASNNNIENVNADSTNLVWVDSDLPASYPKVKVTIDEEPVAPYLEDAGTGVACIGNSYYMTLADALAAAQDGDTIDLLDNTIELDGQTTIDKDVTITNGTFDITNAVCTTEGIIYIYNSSVKFSNVDLKGSNFTSAYGVIFANHNANVTLDNCDFTLENDLAPLGGTLKGNDNASFTVKNCTFDLENPSRVLTNITLDMSDTIIKAYVTDQTRTANHLNNHAFRNVYGEIKDSTIDVTGTETGIKNTAGGELKVSGNSAVTFSNTVGANIYLKDANETLTVEPPANVIGDIVYENVSERVLTDKITVNFVPTADENVYDIVLDGNYKEIYEFVSAEIQFVNAGNGYEIDGTDDINVSPTTDKSDRYGFYLKGGVVGNRITATKIKIGTVTFPEQGEINFKVDADNSKVVATEYKTHLEKYYTAADAKLTADENGITGTIEAPTRDVAINVDFAHELDGTYWADNQITVTLKDAFGNIVGDTAYPLAIANNAGTYTFEDVPVGRITVTLKAPGFRTFTYTTTVEEGVNEDDALVLSFWNDTKRDAEKAVEIGGRTMENNFVVGDIAMDYIVDKYDLAAVTSYYGTYNLTDENKIKYDLNRDGNIDITDVAYVLHNFGF